MSVIRKMPSRYVAVGNDLARDSRLSFRARGVLVYMLSLPEDAQFSADRTAADGKEGRGAILTALEELRSAGYYRTVKKRVGRGRFTTITEVSSEPIPEWIATSETLLPEPEDTLTESGLPNVGQPNAGEPLSSTKDEEQDEESSVTPSGVTAQTLVAEWIEHCTSKPASRVVGQVARELKILLESDGMDPDVVRRGLADWHRKRLHPSTLASVVTSLALGPAERQGRAERALSEGAALIAKLEADEAAAALPPAPPARPLRAVGS